LSRVLAPPATGLVDGLLHLVRSVLFGNHLVLLGERRMLTEYADYYNAAHTHGAWQRYIT
jgi:hypothetical protein